tara:strand:+ start:146 stop:721 length:576 start_codon:yes stop_codon:yes gene_type:complete
MEKFKYLSNIVLFSFFLTGCETFRELSGLTKPEIDDQLVNQTPDLILPPDYNVVPTQSQVDENKNEFIQQNVADPNLGYIDQQFVEPEIRNFVPYIQGIPPTPSSPSDSIEQFRKQRNFTIGEWVYEKSVNEFRQLNLFYRPRINKGYNFSRRYLPLNNNLGFYGYNRIQKDFVEEKNNDLIDIEQVPISE